MKIGILGATGLIGHHLVLQAQLHQHEVVVLHRKSSNLTQLAHHQFESRTADLNDRKSLIEAFSGLDAVINAAAYYPTIPRPVSEELKTSRLQMQFFLDAVHAAGVKRALYVGAAIALPKATTGLADESLTYQQIPDGAAAYVQVKCLMDQMARDAGKAGLPIVIGIPTMCFGEYDAKPTTGRLIVELANESLPAYINGDRNCIYAGDAASGLLKALEKGSFGERYLIGSVNTDVKSIVEQVCELAKVPILEKTLSLPLAKFISRIGEIKYTLFRGDPPKLSSTAIAVLALGQHFDLSKAERELSFKAGLDQEAMLFRAYQWFKKQEMVP